MTTILHLTTLHPRFDPRIFVKEAQTLASHLPHKVVLMVADGRGNAKEGLVFIHDLGNLSGGRLLRMVRGPWRAFAAVIRIKPAIVHFHDPELIPVGLLLKAIGYKIIYDVHEDVPRQTLSKHYLPWIIRKPVAWLIKLLEWFAANVSNAIVPATPKIADRFPAVKTVTVQNFPISNELVVPDGTVYNKRGFCFAYIGGIAMIRGAVEMIRAFDYMNDVVDAKLELAGEFSPSNLEDSIRELPGWALVNYHGQVSRAKVGHIMSKVRAGLVLFHPLPNHIDAQPNKMFEYMSAGLPVIASDFPLWRRIIEGAGCGLLVDPMNPQAIAEAMRWILNHPAEAEAMGECGRRAVEMTYNWDAEASKLLDLYNKLLSNKTLANDQRL